MSDCLKTKKAKLFKIYYIHMEDPVCTLYLEYDCQCTFQHFFIISFRFRFDNTFFGTYLYKSNTWLSLDHDFGREGSPQKSATCLSKKLILILRKFS